ncbi:MFS transporter [Lutispora thermophila]|uniref:MFS transporter, DHA3 family, macrolide efflux protein n=1 Tax=Lutispora thermophila DSM 19022 TaxID=1122184 RepID=A0A1M6FX85_9FIRM|nr:MFS transporter [Lutispora thermophila]SHJ02333.1 MFS transporter, DHA3 family, macrolide efflux protein [Lutispora thermophila DSM 19022]
MELNVVKAEEKGYKALLKYKDFIKIWVGNTISRFGDAIDSIAFLWMVYEMTGSTLMMGTVMAVNATPAVIFGMMAGVLVDRMDKKKVMIITDLLRGISTAMMAFLYISGMIRLWHLYVFTFVNSCCEIFSSPAKASAMQILVDKKHYLTANSLRQASSSVAEIAGTAVAAIVMGYLGIGVAILIDSVTFFISSFTAIIAKLEVSSNRNTPLNVKQFYCEFTEGLTVIKSNVVLLVSLTMVCLVNLVLAPFNVLMPEYSDKILMAGERGMSLILMSFTIGMVAGSLIIGQIGHKFKKSTLVITGFIGLGAGMMLFGFIDNLQLACVAAVVAGAFIPVISGSAMTLMQESTPLDKMGRVSSTASTLSLLGLPLGYAVSGIMSYGINVLTTFKFVGILIVLVAIPPLFIREFRKD